MAAFSFLQRDKSNKFKSVDAAEFKKLITEHKVQLLDVRTPLEYQIRKIEGALLIDLYASDFEEQLDALLDKSIPVAIYCRSGVRSVDAGMLLVEKGFTVYNLRDGIISWK